MYVHNKDLKALNTFGLPCIAGSFFSFTTEEELVTFIRSGATSGKRVFVLGGGSNILFKGNFEGLVIHPLSTTIKVEHIDDNNADVLVSAGVIWDDFVAWTVNQGFGGVENLSFIPGMAGAAPVQNIGAYGSEAADTLLRVRCVMLSDGSTLELTAGECRYGYRDSIFKNELRGKTVVSSALFRLSRHPQLNMAYAEVASECGKIGIPTLENIRKSVINIRKRKLPDPDVTGNAGSFFKNPVITSARFEELTKEYPEIPGFRLPDGDVKIAAGWLIDQCGWKGVRAGNAGVHDKQALVIVNHGNATGSEIIELAEKIRESVRLRFGTDLSPEVEIV